MSETSDLRIRRSRPLLAPCILEEEIPVSAVAAAGVGEARRQIERLYMRHNPTKLDELDGLVERFGEAKLLAMIKEKYGDLDPQERVAELAYLILQKKDKGRVAVAQGGTHNLERITELQA